MARGSGKRRARSRGGREVGSGLETIVSFASRWGSIGSLALLAVITALGVYIRALPAIRYGLELDANDPWIAYWLARYFVENGLFNLDGLRDVQEFWYPLGRDFLHTESLGLSWLAAATYPIGKTFGLTLREWLALFPVFAGGAGILLSYVLVYMLTRSRVAGLTAAAFMAFTPATISRTIAGFVEKIGFSIPFILAGYILLVKAFTDDRVMRRRLYAALAGLFSGSVGWLWGGVELAVLAVALTVLFDAIIRRPYRDALELYAIATAVHVVVSGASPSVGYSYYAAGMGAALPGVLAIYALSYLAAARLGAYTSRLPLWLSSVAAAAGGLLLASGAFRPGARILAALGVEVKSPLVTSVSEHQPATLRSLFAVMGVPLVLSLAALVAEVYNVASRLRRGIAVDFRYAVRLSILVLAAFLIYASKQMSYFMQIGGFYAALGAGIAVGVAYDLASRGGEHPKRRKGRTAASSQRQESMRVLIASVFIIIVTGSSVAYAMNSYYQYGFRAAAIETSYLGTYRLSENGTTKFIVPFNDAWLKALEYINESTPPDALIVSWWDYGYWITVNTGRATVADGATLNETHLMLLARLLTSTEGGASAILREYFHAKPNNTYIVFYDVFTGVLDERNVLTIMPQARVFRDPVDHRIHYVAHGQGDLAKSFQMLRIARRVPADVISAFATNYTTIFNDTRGFVYVHFPGFAGGPQERLQKITNDVLLYRLTIYGMYHFQDHLVTGEGCSGYLSNITYVMPAVRASNTSITLMPFIGETTNFSLEAVVVDCPRALITETPTATFLVMVVVFIYKWTG